MPNPPSEEQTSLSGTLRDLQARLERQLDGPARTWLHQALADAREAHRPAAWEAHFAAARRRCGRTAAPAVRVLLLHAAGAGSATLTRLYRQGTAAERVAVLRALPHLPVAGTPDAVPLVEDALRANDTGLVTAAVGPYAAAHLDRHGWRHAVLKCLFTGVPTAAVHGLARRARGDAELARMLRDFAHERTVAGRTVPADLLHVLDLAEAEAEAEADAPSSPTPEES